MDGHEHIGLEIDPRKIEAYLLSMEHPEGSGKAAYFIRLGYSPSDTARFARDLRRHYALAARGEGHSAPGGTAHAASFVAGSRRIHRFACDPAPRSRHDQHRPARKHFHHGLLGVALTLESDHGREFVVRGKIEGPLRTGAVVSVWLRPPDADIIRLVTASPGDRR